MRQRHVVVWLYLFAAFFIATIIATYLVMDHLRQKHKPIPICRSGHLAGAVYGRRRTIATGYIGAPLASDSARLHFDVPNGVVLIGSDAHIWPAQDQTTAMRAFIKFCGGTHLNKPVKAIILNGDVVDLPQISRHPPIGWDRHPEVADEINAAQHQLKIIEQAAPRGAQLVWTLGNHDARFETRLATVAHEYRGLRGFALKSYFPKWAPCWSVWINNDVVVKHRYKGGSHAPHNNAVSSGKNIVTGHLHSAKVTPVTDYNGTRYGVDTGCLADPSAQAFVDYTEDGPLNWRSGFGVLTFRNGKLLPPELVTVWDQKHVTFRGEIIPV